MSVQRSAAAPPRLDGFSYVSLLGSGGYADVFLYDQLRPRRPVAVKVLFAAGLTESRRHQFTAEADAMALVSAHPYIVTIFDADVSSDGRPYLVMEYYPRPHLGVRAQREHISVAESLRTGIQLASAVESAHRIGILHRDIKPANVLMSEYGRPGLTDFGISANAGVGMARPGDDGGGMSIPWSAPEVFRPDYEPDQRCDVYSLGATVWHLLVGRSPFQLTGGDNRPLAMMRRIENDPVPPTGRDDVPASLVRVLQQAMRKNPTGRHASAFEFARALQAVQLELRFAITQIEVPEVVVRGRAGVKADAVEVDATRFKPRQVEAQVAAADESPQHRSGRASTQSVGQDANDPPGTSPGRRRATAWSLGAFAVLLLATAVVYLVTREQPPTRAESPPSIAPAPQDVTAGAFVAKVDGSATRTSDGVVRFSWTVAEPRDDDFFLVTRSDSGEGPRAVNLRQTASLYELTGIVGSRPCIDVVLVRATGQASEPTSICAE